MDVIYTALKSIFPVDANTVVLGVVSSAALVAIVLLWQSWRSGRALRFLMPRAYRTRPRQDFKWRRDFGENMMPQVDKVLNIICDCFLFNRAHRYQLLPDDEVLGIYRQCRLPSWLSWLDSDAGEIESLLERLGNDFGFDRSHWHEHLTLGEIIKIVQRAPSGN